MQYKRIKELRKERHLTQREMADLLQISLSSYSRYERGVTRIPYEVIFGLANIYCTSVDYLIDHTDQRIPHKRSK